MNSINLYTHGISRIYGNNSNKSKTFSEKSRFANNSQEEQQNSSTRKAKINSSMSVTSYTDKEGRVHRTYTGKGTDVVESMKEAAKVTKDDKGKVKKRLNYSYQKVSNQVLMAKNSMSASKAVLAARRSLADLKRKLKTADCSDDEKEITLTHATRMLRVAIKKKKNLELEELVQNTMKADERNGRIADVSDNSINPFEYDEEGQEEEQDVIDELVGAAGREDAESLEEEMAEEGLEENLSEEELSEELSELLEDMSDEIMAEIAEDLESLMEVINPHMDEEHFEKLKMKHRLEEQKDIVKADTDYLKEYLRIIQGEQGSSPIGSAELSGIFEPMPECMDIQTESCLGFSVGV